MTAGLRIVPIHQEQGCLELLRSQISKYLHQRHSMTLHSFLKTQTQAARFSRQNKKHERDKVIKYSTHAASQLLSSSSAVLRFGWPKDIKVQIKREQNYFINQNINISVLLGNYICVVSAIKIYRNMVFSHFTKLNHILWHWWKNMNTALYCKLFTLKFCQTEG